MRCLSPNLTEANHERGPVAMLDLTRAQGSVSNSDVTIVGAGVAGLAMSLLLAKQGLTSAILERYPDPTTQPRRNTQSINLALSHRGLRTLELVGILNSLQERMVPMFGRMVHAASRDEFQPYDFDLEQAIYSIRRDDIIDALLRKVRSSAYVSTFFDCGCSSIDLPSRMLTLDDIDGQKSIACFQNLIGADGCYSLVRKAITTAAGSVDSMECLDHGFKECVLDSQS